MDNASRHGDRPARPGGDDPFGSLAGLRLRALERGREQSVDGAKLVALADAGRALERFAHWAEEMELGADGFDNTEMSRRYRLVRGQVHEAAGALVAACELLDEGAMPART